jgi:hypothetical protein
MVDLQQRRGDVTFVKLGVGQTPHQRHALDRGQGSGKVLAEAAWTATPTSPPPTATTPATRSEH